MQESATTQDVIRYYRMRHVQRPDLLQTQPFANYGYWTRPGLPLEQAAEALTVLVAASAGLAPGDRVLDIGCGYGACAAVYARCFNPASIIGIDATDVRIETGREYIAGLGLSDRIELRLGDATRLDLPDAEFDKVLAVECAFHFTTRVDFIREAARVLKPGGCLALTDIIPRRGIDPESYLGDVTINTGICLDNRENAYDADTYASHLRDAGFTEIRIEDITEWTRLGFAEWLDREADALDAKPKLASHYRRAAQRARDMVTAGEDYVLVAARKAG